MPDQRDANGTGDKNNGRKPILQSRILLSSSQKRKDLNLAVSQLEQQVGSIDMS